MIHYHGTPFSGRDKTHMALAMRHACVSYAERSAMEVAAELCQSFILDNGAFSAWRQGKPMDLEGFAGWARAWCRHPGFDWLLMPDVIDGDADANALMRARWFQTAPDLWKYSVPVWHLHEPLEVLRDFVGGFRTVAIGSSGDYSKVGSAGWWQRMHEAMEVACDETGRPKAKLHGLRMLDPRIFSCFPFSSADSTNVARNIGIDKAWDRAPYAPASAYTRALVLMERIERHASASRWVPVEGKFASQDLFG